jgi:hypothetical protein
VTTGSEGPRSRGSVPSAERKAVEAEAQRRQDAKVRLRNGGWQEKREDWMPNPILPEQPALYDDTDVAAAKALMEGRAEPYQQTRMIEWFLYCACRLRDWPYVPGDERATLMRLGMQKPAHEFLKLVALRTPGKQDSEQG